MFEIHSEQFTGPLELLLQLIEKEELLISDISLAHVTESYLTYLREHEPPSEELADFLIVATRLLLIKAKQLLPEPIEELEEEQGDLAAQLKMYKAFVDLSGFIEKRFHSPVELFAREKTLQMTVVVEEVVIPAGVTFEAMQALFVQLLKRLEPFFSLKQVSLERTVSVKERFEELRQAIFSRARFTFQEALGEQKTKINTVISFLALLELVKQRVVHVNQSGSFDDIEIKRVE